MDGNPFSTNYPVGLGGQGGGAGGYGAGGDNWMAMMPMILSYVSKLGAGIAKGNPAVEGLDQLTQQTIGAKSQADLMQRLLGGQVPGAKIQISDKGYQISGSSLGDLNGMSGSGLSNAQQGSQLPGGSGTQWNAQNMPSQLRQSNPFSSSQPGAFSYADLAGLTPQDVLQAMNVAGDTLYKQGLLKSQQEQNVVSMIKADTQRLAEWRRIKEIPDKVPVTVNGQVLEVDPKEALSYYAKVNDLPASYETYKLAAGDPEFKSYLLEMAKAGKTEINIGEAAEKRRVLGKVDQELDITDPTYPAKREKMLMSDENRMTYNTDVSERANKLISSNKGMQEPQARNIAKKTLLADTIVNELKTVYGEDKVTTDLVNDVIIIYVDGEVKHRIPL